jgi:hypothetical protein
VEELKVRRSQRFRESDADIADGPSRLLKKDRALRIPA